MSGTQLLSGVGETSTARNFAVCRASLATLTPLVIGLVIMALIVIGLTNPSGAQTNGLGIESTTSSTQQHDGTLFARCLDEEIGWSGFAAPTRHSSLTGPYAMATTEHREPCDSRGSCTVLGAPGGEIPPGDSTFASVAVLGGDLISFRTIP
jgi:hypothetical protein